MTAKTTPAFSVEQHLAAATEAMLTGMVIVDLDGIVVHLNEFTRTVLENVAPGTVSDLLGSDIEQHTVEDGVLATLRATERFPVHVTTRIHGVEAPGLANTVHDADGTLVGYVYTWTPLPESSAVAREAARAASVLRAIIDQTPTNLLTCSADRVVELANPQALRTLREVGLLATDERAVGRGIGEVLPVDAETLARLADPQHLPHHVALEHGEESLELTFAAVQAEDGELVGTTVTFEVTTAEKRLAAEAARRADENEARAATLRNRVDRMLAVVNAAAAGDLTQQVEPDGEDEVAQMAAALSTFLGDLRSSIGAIARNAGSLDGASEALETVSQTMGGTAEQTSSLARDVSAGSQQVSSNVEAVAASAEEMTASIREISQNTAHAANVAGHAVTAARTTNATISKLGDSSTEIGKIVKVITGIAQQTNLLALNATIEAARAGEAGKGFAVVANEVKELAKETARATEDISAKIETIQTDTGSAVEAINEISAIINEISDIQTTIASAVEEQAATTTEISRSVKHANASSHAITASIEQVAEAASGTAGGAMQTQQSAVELRGMATELQELVSRFTF